MSDDYSGWRSDRDRNRRDEDRGWPRRTDDFGRDRFRRGREQEFYPEPERDAAWRDWPGRRRERGSYGTASGDRDRYREQGRPEGHRYEGHPWGNDWGRDRSRDDRDSRSAREAWGRDDNRAAYWDLIGPGWIGGGGWGFAEDYRRDPYYRDRDSWGYGRYPGRSAYGRDRYGYGNPRDQDRGWWDRATDEVSSWFGDDDAERRRQEDARHDMHRGRGPRGYTRSDERIREDVSDRLTDNPILDASDVEVTVASGEVTLSGQVDSRYSKRLAEDIAEDVSGVRHLQNNLRVRETRESISGTYSGISEGGTTSDLGRTPRSGASGSIGAGNTGGGADKTTAR